MHPLNLSASNTHRRLRHDHFAESDIKNHALRATILARDNNTCQFCGVMFSRHMEVSHLNGNHYDHRHENLATICPLCHQVEHLFQAGSTDGGILIHSKTLTQQQINLLSILCWYVIDNTAPPPNWVIKNMQQPAGDTATPNDIESWRLRNSCTDMLQSLERSSTKWTNFLSPAVGEPFTLAEILADLEIDEPAVYADRHKRLSGICLLPSRERFDAQTAHWWPELQKKRPFAKWESGCNKFLSNANETAATLFDAVDKIMNIARPAPVAKKSAATSFDAVDKIMNIAQRTPVADAPAPAGDNAAKYTL